MQATAVPADCRSRPHTSGAMWAAFISQVCALISMLHTTLCPRTLVHPWEGHISHPMMECAHVRFHHSARSLLKCMVHMVPLLPDIARILTTQTKVMGLKPHQSFWHDHSCNIVAVPGSVLHYTIWGHVVYCIIPYGEYISFWHDHSCSIVAGV